MSKSLDQRKLAYFHSLGKSMTESQQNIYESNYKSSHSIRINDIWSDEVSFASDFVSAQNESLFNSAVTYHSNVFLSSVYGSNNQSYVYLENGKFKDNTYPLSERGDITKLDSMIPSIPKYVKPFISPQDVVNIDTNEPSFGYTLRLYRGLTATNGTPLSEIFMTEGSWSVNYNIGMIYFEEGYTPIDMGWGEIKATFFEYSGNYLDNTLYNMNKDNINNVTFLNNILYFTQQDGDIISIDLSTFRNIDIKISHSNNNMSAKITNSINKLACDIPLMTDNVNSSSVLVSVNGIQVNLGNDNNCDCYFSSNNGITKKNLTDIVNGDYLYWNYVNNKPVSGYDLSNIDKITFIYLIS